MSDVADKAGQRDRSPAFPGIPLETALRRLGEFDAYFKRTSARPEKIGDAWQMKGRGNVDRIVAALRYFGLLEYQGVGTARTVVISDEGRKYLRAYQDSVKQEVIRAASLRPKQMAIFWELWGKDRPADSACLDELIQNHGFSDSGARDFLRVYDATIGFAGLADSDKMTDSSQETSEVALASTEQAMNIPQGVTPSVERRHASNLTVPAPQFHSAHRTHSPSHHAPHSEDVSGRPGDRREVFALAEGDVVLTFPASLSQESYEDLEAYLQIFLRKAKRMAVVENAGARSGYIRPDDNEEAKKAMNDKLVREWRESEPKPSEKN